MTLTRTRLTIGIAAALLVLVTALVAPPSIGGAADHLDSPLVAQDGSTDINDVYVFESPGAADSTVLIMTVNPAAGVMSDTTFNRDARYEFLVDTDGDAVQDTTYEITFKKTENGTQELKLKTKGDKPRLSARGQTGEIINVDGGGTLTAGLYDDPFFFDLAGFQNELAFTGDDFFAGLNVSAIVLEVPNSALGTSGDAIGVWARTEVGGTQIDRMGRPAINTVLIPTGTKNAFNAGIPSNDQSAFRDEVVASVTALSGDAAYAEALADVLLPDVNTFTIGNSEGFLNGRQLADDVIDAELNVLTNGAFTAGDGVNANDKAFSNVFPYLASAHPTN
ncbi:MAG: DUF4331 family protein [Acidimicrobiia bacterium]|nr:DUF4331 family protein [Acidimicrobiia bacterium]